MFVLVIFFKEVVMSKNIVTSISLPKNLYEKSKVYGLKISEVCQNALEIKIKKEEVKHQRMKSFEEIKRIYYERGFEDGQRIPESETIVPDDEMKIIKSTLRGEKRFGLWSKVDRVDDIFERVYDDRVFDNIFLQYEFGWVLKDERILNNPHHSWFTDVEKNAQTVEEYRAEAFFEYKFGFVMGLCGYTDLPSENEKIHPPAPGLSNKKLTKKQAINIVRSSMNVEIHNKNTVFSNPNAANSRWWFEPNYKTLSSNFFLILNDNNNRKLFLFSIPENKFKKDLFRDRPEKGRVSIIIESNDRINFMDICSGSSNVKFSNFLIKTIKY